MNSEEPNKRLIALEALLEKAKANAAKYTKLKTKIYKGRLAPQGSLFFGVVVKKKGTTYSNVVMLNCEGKDADTEQLLYNKLYEQLTKKYENLNK